MLVYETCVCELGLLWFMIGFVDLGICLGLAYLGLHELLLLCLRVWGLDWAGWVYTVQVAFACVEIVLITRFYDFG